MYLPGAGAAPSFARMLIHGLDMSAGPSDGAIDAIGDAIGSVLTLIIRRSGRSPQGMSRDARAFMAGVRTKALLEAARQQPESRHELLLDDC
jgi:hypothetical protein